MPRDQASRSKLAREIAAAKAALNGKKGKAKAKARPPPQSVSYTRPLRQGVAAVPSKPFPRNDKPNVRFAFDACHPCHMPLPRAIGGYAVIRTTALVKSNARVVVFGPMQYNNYSGPERDSPWSTICGVQAVDETLAMNAANNAFPVIMSPIADGTGAVQGGWDNCQVTPAAMTVQIMYPAAVGQSGGVARIGRLKTLSSLNNNTRTWRAFGDQFTSYNEPRLCSGGKLCLRGVTVNATPYDMSEMAQFREVGAGTAGAFTWNAELDFKGFAPIVVCNDLTKSTEGFTAAGELEYLITIEWRVRFDPANPAQAAHVHRPPSTDSEWSKAVKYAESMGHGVMDIAERVADYGANHPALVSAIARGVMG